MSAGTSLTRLGAAGVLAVALWTVTGCTTTATSPGQAGSTPTASSSTSAPGSTSTGPTSRDSVSGTDSDSDSGSVSDSPDPTPQEQTMTNPGDQADRDAIIANFRARQQAMIDGDTDQLRALSTPDSHAEHISGYNQPRDEWFDQIESGYFDYHSIDNHSIDVTLTGPDTATLVARSTIDVTIGGSRNTWQLESTAEYVKQDGRWLSGDGSSRTY